jgi:predicted DNA-binding mobile mystery protein A
MTRDNRLARQRLDERFDALRPLMGRPRPHTGWIRAIRQALGMSGSELADRLGVTPQSVSDMERNEASGSIRLATLERAADALGCELEYVLVPRKNLESMVEEQARRKARHHMARIAHHGSLENQALPGEMVEAEIEELAPGFIDKRGLWSKDAWR